MTVSFFNWLSYVIKILPKWMKCNIKQIPYLFKYKIRFSPTTQSAFGGGDPFILHLHTGKLNVNTLSIFWTAAKSSTCSTTKTNYEIDLNAANTEHDYKVYSPYWTNMVLGTFFSLCVPLKKTNKPPKNKNPKTKKNTQAVASPRKEQTVGLEMLQSLQVVL